MITPINYFVIRFSDLSNEKQMDIKETIKNMLRESMTKTELMEVLGADRHDIDQPDVDRFDDWFVIAIEPQIEKVWNELEVAINIYAGKSLPED